jgi:hypothetical protein
MKKRQIYAVALGALGLLVLVGVPFAQEKAGKENPAVLKGKAGAEQSPKESKKQPGDKRIPLWHGISIPSLAIYKEAARSLAIRGFERAVGRSVDSEC